MALFFMEILQQSTKISTIIKYSKSKTTKEKKTNKNINEMDEYCVIIRIYTEFYDINSS